MHLSPERVLETVDEQKANLKSLSHQFNADEFEVVMTKSHAAVVLLQKLIVERTNELEDLSGKNVGRQPSWSRRTRHS